MAKVKGSYKNIGLEGYPGYYVRGQTIYKKVVDEETGEVGEKALVPIKGHIAIESETGKWKRFLYSQIIEKVLKSVEEARLIEEQEKIKRKEEKISESEEEKENEEDEEDEEEPLFDKALALKRDEIVKEIAALYKEAAECDYKTLLEVYKPKIHLAENKLKNFDFFNPGYDPKKIKKKKKSSKKNKRRRYTEEELEDIKLAKETFEKIEQKKQSLQKEIISHQNEILNLFGSMKSFFLKTT